MEPITKKTQFHRIPKWYLPVQLKFWFCQLAALLWVTFSIYLSMSWIDDLGSHIPRVLACLIIAGISYIPGYFNAFMTASLLLDRQPAFAFTDPDEEITIVIACRNEAERIRETMHQIARQDYAGHIRILLVDNGSVDDTGTVARIAADEFGMELHLVSEPSPGKHRALNRALPFIQTPLFVTLDADTLLHPFAIRYIVARMLSAPQDVAAVAGTVLVRNSRTNLLTNMQEWDYFLGIANIKRLQGLYQSTLVAQGAFSLFHTQSICEMGGWPDAIGEDIVLTWRLLSRKRKVYFEPLAVAFTDVPDTLSAFARQRSRWARGMIEALKHAWPWRQPLLYTRMLTGYNLLMPLVDVVYTCCWIPGLIASFFGCFWIVGPATLFVLPLTIVQNIILYRFQRHVFRSLNLRIRRNRIGFVLYVLCYPMLMSPVSVWGYVQEGLRLRRIWK